MTKKTGLMMITALLLASSSAFASYDYKCSMTELPNGIDQEVQRPEVTDLSVIHPLIPLFERDHIEVYLFGNDGKSHPDKFDLKDLRDSVRHPGFKVGSEGYQVPFLGGSRRTYSFGPGILSGADHAKAIVEMEDTNFVSGTLSVFHLDCTRQK